jgi:heme oxygenase-like protein
MYLNSKNETTVCKINYKAIEKEFDELLTLKDLDPKIAATPALVESFEEDLGEILADAFDEGAPHSSPSHLCVHRILYRINRLKLFWYDDLDNYNNENSHYLLKIRNQMESAWQTWEMKQLRDESLSSLDVVGVLRQRIAGDLDPAPSDESLFFRNEMTLEGYHRLLAIASLDGLVEASQLSRVLGGAANEVQSMLTRIFLEEYGGGRYSRKHSSYFSAMLDKFDMNTQPEAYFDLVPWEVLANINLSFFLSENNRQFLRYAGGLLYTEVSVPAAFVNYRLAGERLGLSPDAFAYWDLHIKEDIKHGQWMLDDVAIPLIERYAQNAGEILFGYDQQRFFSARASQSVVKSLQEMHRT